MWSDRQIRKETEQTKGKRTFPRLYLLCLSFLSHCLYRQDSLFLLLSLSFSITIAVCYLCHWLIMINLVSDRENIFLGSSSDISRIQSRFQSFIFINCQSLSFPFCLLYSPCLFLSLSEYSKGFSLSLSLSIYLFFPLSFSLSDKRKRKNIQSHFLSLCLSIHRNSLSLSL